MADLIEVLLGFLCAAVAAGIVLGLLTLRLPDAHDPDDHWPLPPGGGLP